MKPLPPNPLPCGCRSQCRFMDCGKRIPGSEYVVHCRLHGLAQEMLAELIGIQWSGNDVPFEPNTCPACSCDQEDGHGDNCPRGNLIARAKGLT